MNQINTINLSMELCARFDNPPQRVPKAIPDSRTIVVHWTDQCGVVTHSSIEQWSSIRAHCAANPRAMEAKEVWWTAAGEIRTTPPRVTEDDQ